MQKEPPIDLHPYFCTLKDLEPPIDWSEYFSNQGPVQIDVGCGRGLFLYNASEANPEVNYLGIEIDYKEGRRAAKRLMKQARPNARIIGGDVAKAFSEFVPAGSVDGVHVYFPDPWWKPRHHKRRVFTGEFVEMTRTVLKSGGQLHVWTDVFDYWERVLGHMEEFAGSFEEKEAPKERAPEHDMDYQTSFERKKRKDGWPVYRGLWIKREEN